MRFPRLRFSASLIRPHHTNQSNIRKNRRAQLLVQALEERAVPATFVWDGGAGSFEFNDASNWNKDIVPGPGDDAVIPALPGNQSVIARGIISLGSIRSDSPIVLRTGISKYILPGEELNGILLVTAGASNLSKGLYADSNEQDSFWLYATGPTTSLTVNGLNFVNSYPGSPTPIASSFSPYFRVKALTGATIRLNTSELPMMREVDIIALNAGSRIEIAGLSRLQTDYRMMLAASDGGAISMPDLTTISLDAKADRLDITSSYTESDRWYNGLKGQTNYKSGSLSFPKLTSIQDFQDGRTTKTFIAADTGSRLDTPELRSLTNASVGFTQSDWIAPKLNSFTRSSFRWSVSGKTIKFDAMTNITETSFYAGWGFVEIRLSTPIDLGDMHWNTNWSSVSNLSALTITAPQIRGQLGQGHFFRINATNGGLVNLNTATLIDDNYAKTDGGIFMTSDSGGVLRVNVANTSGTNLDLHGDGTAAFDQTVDARFKMLRGWDGKSGKLYGSQMKSLTVDTYALTLYEGCKFYNTNLYDAHSLVTPKLESVQSDFLNLEGWNSPVFPAYRTVTWDGGAGTNLWSDSSNWSDDHIPGPNTTVIIPAQAAWNEIRIDANREVRRIESHEPLRLASNLIGSPITLRVTSGASILHAGVTLKDATIATLYSGTTLDVYGSTKVEGAITNPYSDKYTETKPAKAGFTAADGSWLFVHDTAKFDPGLIELDIRSIGGGSRVIFPSLAAVDLATPRANFSRSIVRLTAEKRAEIDLPQLKTLTGDLIYVTIDNSWISSPKLTGISRAYIRIIDPTDDGVRHSDWNTADMTSLTSSILQLEGADVVESFDKVKSIDETEIKVTGSKVYFPAVDKIDVSKFFYQGSALQELDESKRGKYETGYHSAGKTGLIEIRANEMSGMIPDQYKFLINASGYYYTALGGLISLRIPVMNIQQSSSALAGQMTLSAGGQGVVRAESTTTAGLNIRMETGGAVAFDQIYHGKFRQIERPDYATSGTFYAANMELMTITEPDWRVNTNLNRIVAPKLRMINGNFETVANPFPLLESITGSILLRHEPGTPVSQITLFHSPKIGTIKNLSVTMEEGVRWSQLESQADWSGVNVYRLNADGSKSTVNRSGIKLAMASVSSSPVSVSAMPVVSATSLKSAVKPIKTQQAKAKLKPVPKPPAAKPTPAKKTKMSK
ncbi:MAG: hypothetical protein NT172_11945 [Planctomycetota bacterium]|nr:hypothetical protein [Planctomycetota bacterium]